jgi:hypothetical protein
MKTQAWGECVYVISCMSYTLTHTLRLSFEIVLCKRTPYLTLEL